MSIHYRATKATLVIMAAGLGSRYGGNKQIDRLGPSGETLMEYSIYDAIQAGFDKVVFVIKPELYDVLRDMCGKRLERCMQVEYAFQDIRSVLKYGSGSIARTKPYGTVHAMLSAGEYINEQFAILNADDYYGATTFQTMYQGLVEMPSEGAACMISYRLADTLSENGTVSRGVCKVRSGYLQRIEERKKIVRETDGIYNKEDTTVLLSPDTPVSMNFWGFKPWIIEAADAYFDAFLKHLTPQNQDSAECLLPVMVNDMVRDGVLSVDVLPTDAKWFGVTYREDRAEAQKKLRMLHERGAYPGTLRA